MTTTTTEKLRTAEAEVEGIRAAIAKETREKDLEALKAARVEGRRLMLEFERLELQFRNAEQESAKLWAEHSGVKLARELHLANKPDPLDFPFPTDEELEAWSKRDSELEAREKAVIAAIKEVESARDRTRLPGMAAARQLEAHKYVIQNLQHKLADPKHYGGWPAGSVNRLA